MANHKFAISARNAELAALAALLNNGYLRIYSGTQPASPETALSGNTLLAELRFAATAFAAPSSGQIVANAISDVTAAATGTATFFRCLQSDGTTVTHDGDISTTSAGTGDLQLGSTSIQSGAAVGISSLTISLPQ